MKRRTWLGSKKLPIGIISLVACCILILCNAEAQPPQDQQSQSDSPRVDRETVQNPNNNKEQKTYWPNGKLMVEMAQDSNNNTQQKIYWPNGKLREENIYNKQQGTIYSKSFDPDGKVTNELISLGEGKVKNLNYHDGVLRNETISVGNRPVSEKYYYENGKLAQEHIYNEQGKLARWRVFFSNGKLSREQTFNQQGDLINDNYDRGSGSNGTANRLKQP